MAVTTESPPAAGRTTAPAPRRRSPALPRPEVVLVGLGGLALALLTSWPLAAHLGSRIAPDLGDPVRTAWQIAFAGHQLLSHPTHLWDSNAFYPHARSLLFSDSLLGYAPSAFVGSGPTAALVRYNLLYLLAYALPFVGAYLLARELGVGRTAAVLAGVAFAYAPFRGTESGHLHVISSGGVPLALFLGLRGYRRAHPGLVAAGWVVACWQLSLGFTLGLHLAYLLAVLAAVAAAWWWRRGRPALPGRLVVITVAGVAAFAVVGGVQARAYLRVSDDYPTARRTIDQVKRYSAPPRAFLSAPSDNRLWGDATASERARLSSANESSLFPGVAIVVLAGMGLAGGLLARPLRWAIAAAGVLCALLALGFGLDGGILYRPLFDHLPGFDGIRTPGRIFTLTTLALALLGAAGAQSVMDRVAARRQHLGLLAGAALALVVMAEGSSHLPALHVPGLPSAQAHLPGPIQELPTDPSDDRLYQFWSTAGFPSIANGNSTFDLPAQDDLRGGMQNFPDAQGVQKLRRLGIRTVVLHLDAASWALPAIHFSTREPPDPAAAAARPIAGLPLTRRRVGQLVIYTLEPPARGAAR